MAKVIEQAHHHSVQLLIFDPDNFVLPINLSQRTYSLKTSVLWQIAFADYIGVVDNHYHSDKFNCHYSFILPRNTQTTPIKKCFNLFYRWIFSQL